LSECPKKWTLCNDFRGPLTSIHYQGILQYMKNITISTDLTRAVYRTWDEISPDAGYCTVAEAAELILDRLPAGVDAEVATLIHTHGYVKVRNAVANIL
jgi:hypothetical protein